MKKATGPLFERISSQSNRTFEVKMNIVQAEENLKKITTKFSKESFIVDLLGAYDFPKSTISKLKIKLKKNPEDDVIVPSKLHFVGVSKKELDAKFEELLKDYATVKKQPRFIIVTDYQTIKAYDTKMGEKLDTDIKILSKHPDFFLPWAGIEKKVFQGENPADVKAAEKLAKFFDLILQDNLKLVEKNRHALNVFLTRILFCFFAEDTDIFEKGLFTKSINDHTNKDGNDLADYLQRLFELLNKKSRAGLPEYLREFPYVNGGLFADEFPIPKFSKRSRESLIDLGSDLNWAEINPDIFGSMIQAVVHPDQRAGLGMHYTSVTNIMKVIEPLFLTELKEEFAGVKNSKPKLKKLLERISNIKIFDPACGSGNFLIIAYKELRLLEMDILKSLGEIPMSGISLSNFYGIEIDDFAHEVAKLSLWLAEHQIDVLFNREFGNVKASLPLKDSGRIVCGNAARIEWKKNCPIQKHDEIYILGNPPYLGARQQSKEQKEDIALSLSKIEGANNLDYISIWFYKASEFIRGAISAKYAFVTTNSLTQGEQVSIFWPIISQLGLEIGFCHQSFKWQNNAKNNAGVTCVIIGLRNKINAPKYSFSDGTRTVCSNINGYLVDAKDIYVVKSRKCLSWMPEINYGSFALDDGNYTLNQNDYKSISAELDDPKKYLKRFVGAKELLQGGDRYCIWLLDGKADEYLKSNQIKERIKNVKKWRAESDRASTKKLATTPELFAEIRQPSSSYLAVPTISSERREYLPVAFFNQNVIASNQVYVIEDATTLHFAILSSKMHLLWVKTVSGQLETRVRYSSAICYNNFPVPKLTTAQQEELDKLGQELLAIREKFSNKTLSDLYDPDSMPNELIEIHIKIDTKIDSLYRQKTFSNDEERLSILFKMYEDLAKENA